MMNQTEATFVLVDSLFVYKGQEATVTQRLKNWFNVRQTSLFGKDPRWSATDWKMAHCHSRKDDTEKNSGVFVCMVS